MSWRNTFASLLLLSLTVNVHAADQTKRVLLLAGKGSHEYGAHEHEAGIRVLAKCLEGVPNLSVSTHYVGDGWPDGPELIQKADGIVMFLDCGSRFEQEDAQRKAALEDLMKRGGGVLALHWAVGGPEEKYIPFHLQLVGGCHGGPDRKYTHAEADLAVVAPKHPIMSGIGDFRINDEFYYQLKWAEQGKVTPLLSGTIAGCADQPAAWAFERPDGGRSFGFVCLHAHKNWELIECRRLVAQAVLWSVKLPVPEEGLPVKISEEDLRLPPQK